MRNTKTYDEWNLPEKWKSREYTQESFKIKTVEELNEGSGDMAACSCNSKKKKNKGMKKMLKKMKWENL